MANSLTFSFTLRNFLQYAFGIEIYGEQAKSNLQKTINLAIVAQIRENKWKCLLIAYQSCFDENVL